MADYTLYFSPDSANLVVRMALHEAGVDYREVLVDRGRAEQRSASFLALNPQGLLPVLEHGDTVLFETAAILLYLVDRHVSLGPRIGDTGRGDLYRWLFFLSNTLHAELRLRFYSRRYVSDEAQAAGLRHAVAERLCRHLAMLDDRISDNAGAWLLASGFSVCDLYLAACCRWLAIYPKDDAVDQAVIDSLPGLRGLLDRLQSRPSVGAACEREWIEPPYLLRPRMPEPPEGSVLG